MGVKKMYREGDTFITPCGVFGVVNDKTEDGHFIIKWDGVKTTVKTSPAELKMATEKKLIDYIGCMYHW